MPGAAFFVKAKETMKFGSVPLKSLVPAVDTCTALPVLKLV